MNFEDVIVRVNKPYPKIENATPDAYTVSILKNLAFSRIGEINGILQYIYQSVVARNVDDEISSIFEEIGIVEMMHLDLLMNAIIDFGGNPRYEDANRMPYTTNYINYSNKLKDMLNNNILAEQNAIENYKLAISKVKNESLKHLLERLIEDEELHLNIFKRILNNVEFLSV